MLRSAMTHPSSSFPDVQLHIVDAPLGAGPESILPIAVMDSGLARLLAPRNDCFNGLTDASAFDERLLDHEMAGLAVAAFEKTARFKHLAQLFEHARAAAHHDAVGADIERRLTDIVKQ